jgi:NIPSNAP
VVSTAAGLNTYAKGDTMKKLWAALVLIGVAALACAVVAARADKGDKKVDTRFFELRIYHVAPGKMEALKLRFNDHTNKLFDKHSMTIIGFWTPDKADEADKKLIYILAYPSKEAREKSWKAFREDPDWLAVKSASEKDGKLVEKVEEIYLNPTDFSPIK